MVNVDEATSLLVTQTQLAHSVNDKERDSATITIKNKFAHLSDLHDILHRARGLYIVTPPLYL